VSNPVQRLDKPTLGLCSTSSLSITPQVWERRSTPTASSRLPGGIVPKGATRGRPAEDGPIAYDTGLEYGGDESGQEAAQRCGQTTNRYSSWT